MPPNDRPLAKATTNDEQSDALVVSFGHEWYKPILTQGFSLVIRKRIPSKKTFNWLYMHVNSPTGAICARARILQLSLISAQAALERASAIKLHSSAIRSYIGTASSIGAYELGSLEVLDTPLTTATINSHIVYYPPQSFFILSHDGKAVLDTLAGFSGPDKPLNLGVRRP